MQSRAPSPQPALQQILPTSNPHKRPILRIYPDMVARFISHPRIAPVGRSKTRARAPVGRFWYSRGARLRRLARLTPARQLRRAPRPATLRPVARLTPAPELQVAGRGLLASPNQPAGRPPSGRIPNSPAHPCAGRPDPRSRRSLAVCVYTRLSLLIWRARRLSRRPSWPTRSGRAKVGPPVNLLNAAPSAQSSVSRACFKSAGAAPASGLAVSSLRGSASRAHSAQCSSQRLPRGRPLPACGGVGAAQVSLYPGLVAAPPPQPFARLRAAQPGWCPNVLFSPRRPLGSGARHSPRRLVACGAFSTSICLWITC